MDENTIVPWKCSNKACKAHLGRVVRNGSGVRQLLLYREATPSPSPTALPLGGEMEGEFEVMGLVEGRMEVKCSVCETVRTWVPGEEALRQLLARCGVGRE